MSWQDNYIRNISTPNGEYYDEFTQEWINDYFDDSTLVRWIKEEKYPFDETYRDFEVHIDSVAEVTLNIDRAIGDYITVLFKDCNHRNYRGQKYKWDGDTYLCYDKINKLAKVAQTRLIRCNNQISWVNRANGEILTEKAFVGYEATSTNQQVAKTATIENRRMIIYVQANEKTQSIVLNQRFMFEHSQCYKVEHIDNYNQESGTDGIVTMMKLYLVYSPILPTDNQELNVCDYYMTNYEVFINGGDISQIKGFSGQLTANVVKNGDTQTDIPVRWSTSDKNAVTITDKGVYTLVGEKGSKAIITAYMENNEKVYDTIEIKIVDDYLPEKKIIVSPADVKDLNEKETVNFVCGVYIEGEKQTDIVTCIATGVSPKNYTLKETVDGYSLTNNKMSEVPLILTFSANGCEDVVIKIILRSLL